MPSTPEAQHLVERAARLAREGKTRDEIAAILLKDKRTINRYLAAADVLGLLGSDAGEPPE
jgi:fatty acid-binding protein DegV